MISITSINSMTKMILSTAACLVIGVISCTAEASSTATLRPLMAASFDVGHTHIVTFFVPDNGQCRLTFVMAAGADDERGPDNAPTASRLVVSVNSGADAQFDVAEGGALHLACSSQARAMTLTRVDQVALSPATR
jgi:hypothetical protein